MIDSRVVAVANSLENAILAHQRPSFEPERDLMVIYEFYDDNNVNLLMPTQVEDPLIEHDDEEDASPLSPTQRAAALALATKDAFVPDILEDLPDFSEMMKAEEEVKEWEGSSNYHPRYVSGGLYFPSSAGSLMAMTYFTPGIADVVEALLTPSTKRAAIPFQVQCRHVFAGRTYGSIFQELMSGAVCHKVLERVTKLTENETVAGKWKGGFQKFLKMDASTQVVRPESRQVMSFESLKKVLHENPVAFSALPVGVYRSAQVRGSELGYVVTAPPADFVLEDTDKLYTIASPPFAHLFTRLDEMEARAKHSSNVPCLARTVGLPPREKANWHLGDIAGASLLARNSAGDIVAKSPLPQMGEDSLSKVPRTGDASIPISHLVNDGITSGNMDSGSGDTLPGTPNVS